PFQSILWDPPLARPPRKALAQCAHFFNEGKAVMVALLDSKEIIAWSVLSWDEMWRSRLQTTIGHTAWSPQSKHLLLWNLYDGIDVYHVTANKQPVLIKRNNSKQVELGWDGEITIHGTNSSEVHIWRIRTATQSCVLPHG
ncbi:hypothetical protein BDN67DRAFT_868127, partial [Paxillus ammoniavirescens]